MEGSNVRGRGSVAMRSGEGQAALRVLLCGDQGGTKALLDCLAASEGAPQASGKHDERESLDARQARIPNAPFPELAPDAAAGAWRELRTARRRFLVLDHSGSSDADTRHLIARAVEADAAVVVLDARTGLQSVTRNQTFLLRLVGVPKLFVVVKGDDPDALSQQRFDELRGAFRAPGASGELAEPLFIPAYLRSGGNVLRSDERFAWYRGPSLLDALEGAARRDEAPLRLRVECVDKGHAGAPKIVGTVLSGTIERADPVRILPSGRMASVQGLTHQGSDARAASAGQSVELALDAAVEAGDVIASRDSPPEVAAQFEATVVWMDGEPLLRGRTYLLKAATRLTRATVSPVKYKVNMSTLEHVATEKLDRDDVGVCELELSEPIVFDPYARLRETGSFTLVDPIRGNIVGAGMLHFALRRAHNIHAHALDVDKGARAAAKNQKPCVLWLTGLSGSGKSTIANMVDKRLHAAGCHTYVLDGDNVRHGLNKDLGFTAEDRVENIRRIAEVAKLMVDAGLIVLTAFISPFRAERRMARSILQADEFIEVFVDTPLAVAEERDPKGLYKKARRGEIKNFTGIDSPYESPEAAEIRIDTSALSASDAAATIIAFLEQRGVIDRR